MPAVEADSHSLNQNIPSPQFMETEGSLPLSQQPIIRLHPELE
jgi:hypothetical protein